MTGKRQISFGQINLHKCKAAAAELNQRGYYDITLITEPYSTRGRVRLEVKNGAIIAAEMKEKSIQPRACIRSYMPSWQMDDFTNRDIASAIIRSDEGDFCVSSLYLDIGIKPTNTVFMELVKECKKRKLPLIVGMDSNAHSSMWGAEDTNDRGRELEEVFFELDLVVLNQGSEYTFDTGNRKSIIDVTVANKFAIDKWNLDDWKVEKGESFSDHKYISFSGGSFVPQKTEMRNLNKANWNLFRESLDMVEWPVIEEESRLEDLAGKFESLVEGALERACPRRPVSNKRINSWWDHELEKSLAKVRHLRDWKDRSHFDENDYKVAKKAHLQLVSQKKQQAWKDFCSNVESANDISNVLRALEGKYMREMSLLKDKDSNFDPEAAVKILLRTHFPDHLECLSLSQPEPDLVREGLDKGARELDRDTGDFIEYISTEKVRNAMRSFGSKKAPGPDGFKPIVLKNLNEKAVIFLTSLYKMSIRTQQIPSCWRKMDVIFIPKPGKEDYTSPKSYRPITLSSFLLKGLERIMLWYLREKVITKSLVSQHAYTRGLSTESALSEVLDHVESSFYRREKVMAVSLDCTGAFDCVGFDAASEALIANGVPEGMSIWYTNLLKGREVTANLQGVTKTITPGRGSPQGGILSPLVWNLVMDSLLKDFQSGPVKAVGYADDIIIMAAGNDMKINADSIQLALNKVIAWGKDKGLVFNPTKTQAIIFDRAKKYKVSHPSIMMEGQELKFVDQIKYLGMTIQSRLSWTAHVVGQIKKANMLLNRARTVIGREWGLDPERALWVYTAIARPKVTYGSLVWAHSLNKTLVNKLKQMQRKILIAISGALRSTPTEAMEVIAGLIPLDLHIMELAARSRVRTKPLVKDRWDGIDGNQKGPGKVVGHRRYWDKFTEGIGRLEGPPQRENSWLEWEFLEEEAGLTIYSDGAGNSQGAGYGFVAFEGNRLCHSEKGSLGRVCPYEAELYAVRAALSWLVSNPHRLKGNVVLYTDSKSVELVLKSARIKSTAVQRVLDLIIKVKEACSFDIRWIRGHSGNEGQELADGLAKEAAREIQGMRVTEVTLKDVKHFVQCKTAKTWQARWQNHMGAARKFIQEVNPNKMKYMKKMSKKNLGIIFQAITGHGLFGHHISKWKNDVDQTCQGCLEEEMETAWHLWSECPALTSIKQSLPQGRDVPMEVVVLRFFKTEPVKELMELRTKSLV